mmetsp:Transcript_36661/g.59095  ORF Transcript_36661/g.59095 Transcript_36661/m.59095 type:complete len:498 (+) Transcript_36661:84-1577(+)
MKRSAAQASSGHSPCPETGRGGDRGTRRKVVDKEEEGKEEEEEKHVGVPVHEQLLELCTNERPGMPQASSGHPPCPKAGREGDCEARRKVDNEDEGNCRSEGTPYVGACLAKVPAQEQIAQLLELCTNARPGMAQPLLRRTASLSGDIEGAARSLLPAETPALYPRVWVNGVEAPREGVQLKFMQFNVLADGLSGEDPSKGGFNAVPPQSLDWQFRRINLVREIFRQGVWPDIISMEEVDHYYDWFEPLLTQLGYAGKYKAKPNSPCKKTAPHSGLEDGCALFWRTDTVTMMNIETMNFNNYNDDGTLTGEKSNQVAILATLQVRGAVPVVAAVTHLSAAKTVEGEQARSQQMNELIEHLETFQLPCIVGLDMNAEPPNVPGAKYPAKAYPLAISKQMLIHGEKAPLRSAYALAMGKEPNWTTWKKRTGRGKQGEVSHTIDYVLISPEIRCSRVLLPPADKDVVPERLPGWSYPSDHVALLAELSLPFAVTKSVGDI